MADSLFDDQIDDKIDYIAELTKPGAKFDKTKYANDLEMYQAIAKGKYHGDKAYDVKLEQFDQLREDYLQVKASSTTKAQLEELETRLKQHLTAQNDGIVNTDTNIHNQPTFDLKQIEDIATAKAIAALEAREAKKAEDNNLAVVESRLRERFGTNAKEILRDKMNSLGLTAEDLRLLAKKSPDVAINALGLNVQQQQYQNPPSSNIRSDSFKPSVDVRDAVYYEKLRRDNPTDYYSPKTSVQRLQDMDHPDFLKRFQEQQNVRAYT